MSEQNHPNEKPEMASEPAMAAYSEISRMKSSIIQSIQKSEDQDLLEEIYHLLQSSKTPEKPINLSKHIENIFSQYPETLRKLAQ